MSETATINLASRLLAVMGEVPYIQKGGKTQSGPSFKYVRHDDVVALVRPALVKYGVAFLASVRPESLGCVEVSPTKSGTARYKTTLMVDMTFVNVDDPTDAYSVSFPGEGIDTEDKASGKALSYALKNGLLKTFMIESGDEADNEASAGEPQSERTPAAQRRARHDEQVEQAAAPAPTNGNLTKTQARNLHECLLSKGRSSLWFLERLAAKNVGDGVHLTSLPADQYDELLTIITGLPDATAAPAQQPATAAQEATESAPAPAAAPEPPEAAESATEPEPPGMDAEQYAAQRAAQNAAPAPRNPGTISPPQLTRLGALCQDLENEGVGRDQWRIMMSEKEGVSSRTELTKAAATRMIDYLQRWITDVKSGVIAPGEKVA